MGFALFAPIHDQATPALPIKALSLQRPLRSGVETQLETKAGRVVETALVIKAADRSIIDVPTISHDQDLQVMKRQPFAHLRMALATSHPVSADYPRFDPLSIFAANSSSIPQSEGDILFDSDVDTQVTLRTTPFSASGSIALAGSMSEEEAEESVRTNGSLLADNADGVTNLAYIDPRRFADADNLDFSDRPVARIVEENKTISVSQRLSTMSSQYAEDVIPMMHDGDVAGTLRSAGYENDESDQVSAAFDDFAHSAGDIVRVGVLQIGQRKMIVRASLYRGHQHLITIARDDAGLFIRGNEPNPTGLLMSGNLDDRAEAQEDNKELPSVYDGIYRASLYYGMTQEMIGLVVKLLANSVDFQAQLKPSDALETFFSVKDASGSATASSSLLYLGARFGDRIVRRYRFEDPTDHSVDYYDENGQSARPFLLRIPVPNGVFTSGFGMRMHPILGFARMHTGADWAAPSGTPILSTGDGVVIKAGWDSGGYGNQTLIKHANGYVTSYNHQSAIAKGVVVGSKIVQGQIIGWVGTSGESTGPHLHYELIVNGTKVDPLKVRLPVGKTLSGDILAKFETERQRLDDLLSGKVAAQVAANSRSSN